MTTVTTDIAARFADISASLIKKAESDKNANQQLIRLLYEAVKPIIKYLDNPRDKPQCLALGNQSATKAMARRI